jgi:putative SOS response-associated peptidase YedK
MRMWPISTQVNKPENDDPSMLEPVELAAMG